MSGLNISQLDDLILNTNPFWRKKTWKDISLTRQHHVITSAIFQKAKETYRGGVDIREQVQVKNAGTFSTSGLYATVNSKVVDHTKQIVIPWTAATVHKQYEIDEDAFQSGPETILRLIDVRTHSMWNDYFDGMESLLWGTAPGPDAQPLQMFGILDWLQKATSDSQAFGFNGGNPSLYPAGLGNLDASTYTGWKNANFGYSQLSQNDGLRKLTEATHKCNFITPHQYNELGGGEPDWSIYTTYPVIEDFHDQQTASNDNLGIDTGKFRGRVVFRGIPVMDVPALTNTDSEVHDPSKPLIGINWRDVEFCFKTGRDRYPLTPVTPELQPTVRRYYYKSWFQLLFTNRRSSFIGNTPSLSA